MKVAESIFEYTKPLPKSEDYGLTSQIRRSALSVSANITEAFGRNSTKEKIHFYYISRGSAFETMSHLEYATRVGYISRKISEEIEANLSKIIQELNRLISAFRR